jgi:hypothetical protein
MKKYLFGILAVALAIGFSAFTKPAKKLTAQYLFTYIASNGFSQANVENPDIAHWGTGVLYTGQLLCVDVDEKACKIIVDESFTELNASSQRILNVSTNPIDIVATQAAGLSVYYVDQPFSTGVDIASNRSN